MAQTIDCPRCIDRLADLEDFAIGNNARESMGHAMYHTKDGATALCIADRKPATI